MTDRQKGAAISRIMVERLKSGHCTSKNSLLRLGYSAADIDRLGELSAKQAMEEARRLGLDKDPSCPLT